MGLIYPVTATTALGAAQNLLTSKHAVLPALQIRELLQSPQQAHKVQEVNEGQKR